MQKRNTLRPEFEHPDSTIDALPEAVQDRLARILDDYLVAAELGSPISPEELLARHPEDAQHLRGYLSGLELFHAAAAPKLPQAIALSGGKLQVAQTIGDFRLVREIGRGGMGLVYEAEQISLKRRVALKILPFAAGHDEKQIGRFKNEAQAAARVEHPNIVPVYAVGHENGVHYYAMQLIDGQSLTRMLAELQPRTATVAAGTTALDFSRAPQINQRAHTPVASRPVESRPVGASSASMSAGGTNDHVHAVARLGVQAAEALAAAHEYGIVHRDVKPSNLLVDDHGKLWVTDFGLARCREGSGLTQSGDILGTMRYMSPEQALGRGGLVDHRTDIYSLGVTLYELATLHHPAGDATDAQLLVDRRRYASKPMRHWNRHIPIDFQTIIMKAIAEFPHERYATAQAFADDLHRFLEGKPILASPPGIVSRTGKWARRHRGFVAAAAAVMLVAIAGQFVNSLLLFKEKAETERALAASQDSLHQAADVLYRLGSETAEQLAAIPGADGVRYQLLDDTLGFYRQLEAQATGNAALQADLALAYSKTGSLSELLGKNEEALEKHLAARDLWAKRVAEQPANAEFRRNLALCQNNVGLLLADLGRGTEALDALRAAQQIQEKLHANDPQSADISTELATTESNLGLVLRQTGRPDEAIAKFRSAIALLKQSAEKSPDREAALRTLAASYNNLGSLLDDSAPKDAMVAYEEAIGLQKQLVVGNKVNRLYQGDLARTYNNLGYAHARQGDWKNAEMCYRDAVRLQQVLVEASPLAASYRRDLAISYNNIGMAASRDGRFAEAESSFRQALELSRLLESAEPSDAKTLSNLGGVYNNLGLLFDRQQHFPEAEAAFQHAIEFQKQAVDTAPTATMYLELLSNHYTNYAKCLRRQQKLSAADDVARQQKALLAGQPGTTEANPHN
jgi:eukaryotic-like serine/threonine-protein kinase